MILMHCSQQMLKCLHWFDPILSHFQPPDLSEKSLPWSCHMQFLTFLHLFLLDSGFLGERGRDRASEHTHDESNGLKSLSSDDAVIMSSVAGHLILKCQHSSLGQTLYDEETDTRKLHIIQVCIPRGELADARLLVPSHSSRHAFARTHNESSMQGMKWFMLIKIPAMLLYIIWLVINPPV